MLKCRFVRPAGRRAFTLVELLVAIGIIALLLGILLPALGAAREAGRTVACGSNMRQVGQAIVMYAGDNGQRVPFGAWEVEGPQRFTTWDDLLAPYLGTTLTDAEADADYTPRDIPVVRCPADGLDRIWAARNFARSYGIVRVLRGSNGPDGYGFAGFATHGITRTPTLPRTFRLSAKLTDARRPSETLLIVERPNRWNSIGTTSGGTYVDRPADQSPFGTWSEPEQIPNQSSHHDLKRTLHGKGRWNYLFADGHVSPMLPRETLGSRPDSTVYSPKGMWTRDPND